MRESGLLFYQARYYDHALGRFTSSDTIVPEPGNPLAWDGFIGEQEMRVCGLSDEWISRGRVLGR